METMEPGEHDKGATDNESLEERCWQEEYKGDSRKWLIRDASAKRPRGPLCSAMKESYLYPERENPDEKNLGRKRKQMLLRFYEEAIQEAAKESQPADEPAHYCTEYDGNFKAGGFEPQDEFYKESTENRVEMAQFFQEVIDEHKRTFEPSHLRDLLDTYLYEIQKATEEGVGHHLFEGKDHDRQMQKIIGDLFSAGMETIKSSLHRAVLFMLHNPEHMRAVQEELDQVVGRQRLPKLEDLPYLPVTESTILETLRISSIVPMGTTHSPINAWLEVSPETIQKCWKNVIALQDDVLSDSEYEDEDLISLAIIKQRIMEDSKEVATCALPIYDFH